MPPPSSSTACGSSPPPAKGVTSTATTPCRCTPSPGPARTTAGWGVSPTSSGPTAPVSTRTSHLAFVATPRDHGGLGNLRIMDVTNPTSPTLLAEMAGVVRQHVLRSGQGPRLHPRVGRGLPRHRLPRSHPAHRAERPRSRPGSRSASPTWATRSAGTEMPRRTASSTWPTWPESPSSTRTPPLPSTRGARTGARACAAGGTSASAASRLPPRTGSRVTTASSATGRKRARRQGVGRPYPSRSMTG